MKSTFTDIVTYSFVVAGILVLTRPGSQGPAFVSAIGNAYSHIIQAATGQPLTIPGRRNR